MWHSLKRTLRFITDIFYACIFLKKGDKDKVSHSQMHTYTIYL